MKRLMLLLLLAPLAMGQTYKTHPVQRMPVYYQYVPVVAFPHTEYVRTDIKVNGFWERGVERRITRYNADLIQYELEEVYPYWPTIIRTPETKVIRPYFGNENYRWDDESEIDEKEDEE